MEGVCSVGRQRQTMLWLIAGCGAGALFTLWLSSGRDSASWTWIWRLVAVLLASTAVFAYFKEIAAGRGIDYIIVHLDREDTRLKWSLEVIPMDFSATRLKAQLKVVQSRNTCSLDDREEVIKRHGERVGSRTVIEQNWHGGWEKIVLDIPLCDRAFPLEKGKAEGLAESRPPLAPPLKVKGWRPSTGRSPTMSETETALSDPIAKDWFRQACHDLPASREFGDVGIEFKVSWKVEVSIERPDLPMYEALVFLKDERGEEIA